MAQLRWGCLLYPGEQVPAVQVHRCPLCFSRPEALATDHKYSPPPPPTHTHTTTTPFLLNRAVIMCYRDFCPTSGIGPKGCWRNIAWMGKWQWLGCAWCTTGHWAIQMLLAPWYVTCLLSFLLEIRSHSISFTRAQGFPNSVEDKVVFVCVAMASGLTDVCATMHCRAMSDPVSPCSSG